MSGKYELQTRTDISICQGSLTQCEKQSSFICSVKKRF